MSQFSHRAGEADFRRLARVKQSAAPAAPALGPAMLAFFKQSVEKRQTKFAKIAKCWVQLVPETLAEHARWSRLTAGR